MQPVVQVEMSRQVKLVADKSIQDAANDSYDAIALPVRYSPPPAFHLCMTMVRRDGHYPRYRGDGACANMYAAKRSHHRMSCSVNIS